MKSRYDNIGIVMIISTFILLSHNFLLFLQKKQRTESDEKEAKEDEIKTEGVEGEGVEGEDEEGKKQKQQKTLHSDRVSALKIKEFFKTLAQVGYVELQPSDCVGTYFFPLFV